MATALKRREKEEAGAPEAEERVVEYKSFSNVLISFIKSCYQSYDPKCEKHYSYADGKIVPYRRELKPGIHIRGDIRHSSEAEAKYGKEVNVGSLRFEGGREVILNVDLVTDDSVISESIAVPIYVYDVRGWRDFKQAWAIAITTIKKYGLDKLGDYIVFPHYYRGRKSMYDFMILLAIPRKELEKVDNWFRESILKLVVPSKPVTEVKQTTAIQEVKPVEEAQKDVTELIEDMRRRIEEFLEEPRIATKPTTTPPEELEKLRRENEELKRRLSEMEERARRAEEFNEKIIREFEEFKASLEKRFEEWLRGKGLTPIKVIDFELPTEYMFSKVKYVKTDEGIEERKLLKLDPAVFRTLRRRFYDVLHKNAYKVGDLWVLMKDADLDEINKIMEEVNDIIKRYDIGGRYVTLVDAYIPTEYASRKLKEYIEEWKGKIVEREEKLKEIEELKEKRRIEKEIEEMRDILAKLEKELRELEKKQFRGG